MRKVTVLGSTGSIGVNSLEVIARHADRLAPFALTAHSQVQLLAKQCHQHLPQYAVISDTSLKSKVSLSDFPPQTTVLFGTEAVANVASHPETDIVVSAIVGAAGLEGTWAAAEAGKRIALANKETLVLAGQQVMDLAAKAGATIIPVDSEHSALFQSLQSGGRSEVKRLILTASGGPFRTWPRERIAQATPAEGLAHPTWTMGRKITIDSATMMNKALELIEARWLFGIPASQLEVVIHPQSIVHSLVEYIDGSVIAQLSPPDMKLPIQYALTYPDRWPGTSLVLDWAQAHKLEFFPKDVDRFPALQLGFEVAQQGGSAGAVLNACNEIAVQRFLDGQLNFLQIPEACRQILQAHDFDSRPSLSQLLQWDAWARQEMLAWNC